MPWGTSPGAATAGPARPASRPTQSNVLRIWCPPQGPPEGYAATFGATRACPGACAFYKTKGPLARPFRSALATILGRPEHRCRHLAVVEHLALGPNGDVKVTHAP